MVYVDVPGLPKDFNVKYRPPRVSLFPPSYRDRAFLRSIHRDVLRQTALIKKEADKKGAVLKIEPAKVEAKPENATTGCQTIESHCYHVCPAHPQEEEPVKKHRKPRVLKTCCCMKNVEEEDEEDDSDDESDESIDSEDSDEDYNKCKCCKNKKKNKRIKSKSHKCKGKDESDLKIPDSIRPFLPYPLSSPNADLFWGQNSYQQPFVERPFVHKEDPPAWNLDHKLEAARRADEKYVWNILAQHGGNDQQSAFQWLAERDRQRQTKLAQAAYGLAELSFDPKFDRTPLAFPPGRGYPHFQPPEANHGGCPCVNAHSNHNLYGQHNQQQFKKYEPSGNQSRANSGEHASPKAWDKNHVYTQHDQWHKAGHRETANPDQWTSSSNREFGKDSKKKGMWSPELHENSGPDNGQQNIGLEEQDTGGDALGDLQHHPFFADNPPIADAHHNDHMMSGANMPGSIKRGSPKW
ncbi:MAG: hypothetical protein GOMPHAMPRED_008044 [Gomphillus americanus]|uniref:Uncharacterized protein n=1 Tax=Gomphillus americanus TaxID=1940652 RepID=A0A8H3EUR4_9LECA|nr:MAG: hypothetical protein GOMPHAMPRED_008044 [Gomphillus americanus]